MTIPLTLTVRSWLARVMPRGREIVRQPCSVTATTGPAVNFCSHPAGPAPPPLGGVGEPGAGGAGGAGGGSSLAGRFTSQRATSGAERSPATSTATTLNV